MDAKYLKNLINARDALNKIIDAESAPANGGAGKEEPVAKAAKKAAPAKKPAAKVAAGEEEAKPAAKSAAKKTDGARITRIAGKQAESIKKALGLSDEQKKEFETAKASFKDYITKMSDKDYEAKDWDEHVSDWAKIKDVIKTEAPLTFEILTIEELQEVKDELTETKTVGVFWNPSKGVHVTGPVASSEEGLDEVGDHLIGETTKRVYNKDETFLGFAGIGEFKDIEA
jgi:hypothetical protein